MIWRRHNGPGVACYLLSAMLAALTALWPSAGAALVVAVVLLVAPAARAEELEAMIARDAQAILDAAPDACVILRADGTIVWANTAAREQFGLFSPGTPFTFAMRVPELIASVERVARTGRQDEVRWSEKVPTRRWYQAFVRPFTLSSGALRPKNAIAVFIRDLTEQQRLDRMREDFVANASHELRTPLAALTGFIETLQGPAREDPKARDQFLGIMREQAERMKRLTDALLSLSRIEMRVHVRPTDTVDLSKTAHRAVEMIRSMAREYSVELDFEAAETPLFVRGDADELFQVADNLIENAIKYGGSGGKVSVRTSCERAESGSYALLSVEDFGAGIAPEHVPRLTERFYRVDTEASRAKRGTGLGLAIVKHIVTRHRGRLIVRSQLGAGSTFTVRIPIDPPQKA